MVYNVLNSASVPVCTPNHRGAQVNFVRFLAGTSPWTTRTEERLFWGVVIIAVPVGYAMLSALCAIGADCTLANADLANWLFGK